MAAKITRTTNPVTTQGGNILSPSDWISRILWVAMFGAVFSIGARVLQAADRYVPGNNTPAGYRTATTTATVGGPVIY